MNVQVGAPLPLDIHITRMPEYDDNDQYIGACTINGVPHHITPFRVIEDDHEQDAAPGHQFRLDVLQDFEDDVVGFMSATRRISASSRHRASEDAGRIRQWHALEMHARDMRMLEGRRVR